MASIGQVIFWGMIILIFIVGGFIILILCLAFTRSQGSFVESIQRRHKAGRRCDDHLGESGTKGVVFHYQNRAAQLKDQNPEFKDRAQLFLGAIATGNASLLLRRVDIQDAGEYQCSVSAPSGQGKVSMHLRVAAYSSPSFSIEKNVLTAKALRWYPKPNVTWTELSRALNSSTQFFNNSAGIFRVVTKLQNPLQEDDTYTCLVRNHLVTSVSQATVAEGAIKVKSYFIFSPAAALLPLHLALTAPLHLLASCQLT
ncbi:hypothetical protein AGOR_G00217330 [Albula goreensis]|uniref:Ig-like domain-containing protein n=1 Tax=Albula goreensis TaxID=1534307 RepID=A0A8T3CMW3_9TELE|nr:hypothetical protein AGOR_G00217330 [Albula goreensis]